MSLCQECNKRQFCSCLCPEAELALKDIEIPQREKTIGLPRFGKFPDPIGNTWLTVSEKRILTLQGVGLTRRQICELLHITRATLRNKLAIIKAKK